MKKYLIKELKKSIRKIKKRAGEINFIISHSHISDLLKVRDEGRTLIIEEKNTNKVAKGFEILAKKEAEILKNIEMQKNSSELSDELVDLTIGCEELERQLFFEKRNSMSP